MSISQLTAQLHRQLAGNERISYEQVQEWQRLYPYFSLPLQLYVKQEGSKDSNAMSLSAIYASDTAIWAEQLGLCINAQELYGTSTTTQNQTTEETIDLFLHTYGKNAVYETELPTENEENNILKAVSSDISQPKEEEMTPLITIPAYDYMSQLERMPDAEQAVPLQEDALLQKFLDADAAGETLFSKPELHSHASAQPRNEEPVEENEPLLSESLAKIYIQQRRYAKALEIIRKLSLNNPEKNIYFADQIRFLEKLIINVKN